MDLRNISRIGVGAVRAAGAQRVAAAARPAAKDVHARFGSTWTRNKVHGEGRMEELAASLRSGPSGRAVERAHRASRSGAGEEQALPKPAKTAVVSVVAMALLFGLESHARGWGAASCDQLVVPSSADGRGDSKRL